MIGWFKKKTKLELLKENYRSLMKKSFEVALINPSKSDKFHRQADKLFEEIRYLSLQQE